MLEHLGVRLLREVSPAPLPPLGVVVAAGPGRRPRTSALAAPAARRAAAGAAAVVAVAAVAAVVVAARAVAGRWTVAGSVAGRWPSRRVRRVALRRRRPAGRSAGSGGGGGWPFVRHTAALRPARRRASTETTAAGLQHCAAAGYASALPHRFVATRVSGNTQRRMHQFYRSVASDALHSTTCMSHVFGAKWQLVGPQGSGGSGGVLAAVDALFRGAAPVAQRCCSP